MNDTVRRAVGDAVLCWLATADGEGRPNVSPKEIFAPLGEDRIAVAEIASPRSAANIAANPRACISLIDVFRQKGFKLEGAGALLGPQDAGYAEAVAPLEAMTGGHFPIRGVFVLSIEAISPIVAPSYALMPGKTEAARVAEAHAAYGVRPA